MINSLIRSIRHQFRNLTTRRPTRRRRPRSASPEQLEARHLLSVVVEPVVDYATGPASVSGVDQTVQLNDNVVIFTMSTLENGRELWRSDGTATGTFRLTDIEPGPGDSIIGQVTSTGSTVFFTVFGLASANEELWQTNGTQEGTQKIFGTQKISGTQTALGYPGISKLTKLDESHLAFILNGEVWVTDGTSSGTEKTISLVDQSAYIEDLQFGQPNSGVENVFLTAYKYLNDSTQNELILYNLQSKSTTVLLSKERTTTSIELDLVQNGRLIFNLTDGDHGTELWYSDGTPGTTVLWMDINPGPASSAPANFTTFGNSVYFVATSAEFGNEVWFINENNSLPQVIDIASGTMSSYPNHFAFAEGFYAHSGYGIYRLEGGNATKVPQNAYPTFPTPVPMQGNANHLYFFDGRLAFYDGTSVQAVRTFGKFRTFLGTSNSGVLFLADDLISGLSIWKSNGTASGTSLVLNPDPGTASSYPSLLTNINGDLAYFTSDSPYFIHNSDLLQVTGTNQVQVIDSGLAPIYGREIAVALSEALQYQKVVGSRMQIAEWNGNHISLLTNVTSNGAPAPPIMQTNGRKILLLADEFSPWAPMQLWTADSNGAPTEQLAAFTYINPDGFTEVAGRLYFQAFDSSIGQNRVWRTDGTVAGTIPISQLSSEFGQNNVFYSGDLVFSDTADYNGIVFLNGSTDEVRVVKDLGKVQQSTELFMTHGLDTLLLRHGDQIWRTRGTAETTQLVTTLPGAVATARTSTAGGLEYFILSTFGTEERVTLWKSDGTATGTSQVAVLPNNIQGYRVHGLTEIQGKLFFFVEIATTGYSEVWTSDGSQSGTLPIATNLIIDGQATLVSYDGGIAFPAATPEVGYEVFRIDTTIPVVAPANIAVHSYGEGTDLTWPDVAGAIQYDVWMQNLSDPSRPVIRKRVNDPGLPLLNDTGYAIDNKLGTSAYRVWIRSLPVLGQPSSWSAAQDIVVGRNPVMHSIPSHIVQSKPTFQWTGPDDVDTYEIWLTNRDTNTRVFYADGLKQTSLQSAQTLPPAKYSVWVRGTRKNRSTTNWSTITDFVVLAPATQLTGGIGVQATQRPTFTWQSVSGATGYDIQVFLAGSSTLVYRSNNVHGLQHVPTKDLQGGNYSVFIRALKGNRQFSAWSQAQSVHILVPPANLRSTNSGFAWDAVPMATSYTFELRNAVTQAIILSATLSETTLTLTSPLSPGRYSLRVQANVAGSSSQWSSALAYEVFRPVAVSITSANTPTVDRTPTITWAPVAGAKNYEVVISQAGNSVPIYDQANIVGFWHQVNTALLPGTYQIQVRAGFFDGSRSNLSAVQTLVIGPAPVLSFDSGKLQWNNVNGATRYEMWVDYLGTPVQQKIVYLPSMLRTQYTLPTTLPKGHYQAWVRAIRFERGEQYGGLWSTLLRFEIL